MEIKKNEIEGIMYEIIGTIAYLLLIFIAAAIIMR